MLFFLLFLCLSAVNFLESKQPVVHVTVFIHGTQPVKKLLDHPYSPMRKIIHFEPGLNLAKDLPENYSFYKVATSWCAYNPTEYNMQNLYTYGWNSSDIRPINRYEESRKLFDAVNQKVQEYSQEYEQIKIRVVGFSHGGNLLLNMLQWMPFGLPDVETEVILLGTPIQEENRACINSPYVSRAYSFYSTADWIQVIDPQRLHTKCPVGAPFFSKRTFLPTDQVVQIALTVNGQSIGHINYRSLMSYLPDMLQQIQTIVDVERKQDHITFDYKK